MSFVTDVLLCTALGDGASTKDSRLNANVLSDWLVEHYGPACALEKLSSYAGGNKAMQADVFGVAVNFCNREKLIAAFQAISWQYPESAQLFLKHEDSDSFQLYAIADAMLAERGDA